MADLPQTPLQSRRLSRWWWTALLLPAVLLDFTGLFTGRHATEPADAQAMRVERAGLWMAWAMVGLLIFLGLLMGALVWRFRNLSRNPDPALALLDELYQSERAARRVQDGPQSPESAQGAPGGADEGGQSPPPAWEKPGDWWRRDEA